MARIRWDPLGRAQAEPRNPISSRRWRMRMADRKSNRPRRGWGKDRTGTWESARKDSGEGWPLADGWRSRTDGRRGAGEWTGTGAAGGRELERPVSWISTPTRRGGIDRGRVRGRGPRGWDRGPESGRTRIRP